MVLVAPDTHDRGHPSVIELTVCNNTPLILWQWTGHIARGTEDRWEIKVSSAEQEPYNAV